MSVKTFIFMGRPGAGKGVQSDLLSKEFKYPIFSTGGRAREIAKDPTTLGIKVKEIMDSGGLTPFWFASYLFQNALFSKKEGEGLIFEGVGRKEPEARLFHEIHEWLGEDFRVFHLNVSPETVMKRLHIRRELEGRPDDAPDKILVRLDNFDKETAPALNFFRSVGKVVEIDGEPLPEVVSAQILAEIKKL